MSGFISFMIVVQISAAKSDEQQEVKYFNHEVEYYLLTKLIYMDPTELYRTLCCLNLLSSLCSVEN